MKKQIADWYIMNIKAEEQLLEQFRVKYGKQSKEYKKKLSQLKALKDSYETKDKK